MLIHVNFHLNRHILLLATVSDSTGIGKNVTFHGKSGRGISQKGDYQTRRNIRQGEYQIRRKQELESLECKELLFHSLDIVQKFHDRRPRPGGQIPPLSLSDKPTFLSPTRKLLTIASWVRVPYIQSYH